VAFVTQRLPGTEEKLSVGGGLTARDTETGAEIEPGCCLGLEMWRDWKYLLDGRGVRWSR
jgi:hypothetical protein